MTPKAWVGIIIALFIAVMVYFFLRPAAIYVARVFHPNPRLNKIRIMGVGQVEEAHGAIFVRHAGHSEFETLHTPAVVQHLDQILVGRDSSAVIRFNSGWKISLLENTVVTAERYQAEQPSSPILLSFTRGTHKVLAMGPAGALFVMQDKKVQSPDEPKSEKVRTAEVMPEPMPLTAPTVLAPPKIASALPSAPDVIRNGREETLSSSYIEEILGTQAGSLRRCQLNSLRDNQPAEGSMLFSLTIGPTGHIDQIKVLQDAAKNSQLTSCATSVLERAQFKNFAGSPITLTYPIDFR